MIVLDEAKNDRGRAPAACAMEIFIDLTTTAHALGKSAGTTRVEWQLTEHVTAQEAVARRATQGGAAVRYVAWSSAQAAFIEVSRETLSTTFRDDCIRTPGSPRGTRLADSDFTPAPGTRRILLVTGAGWLSNSRLLHELRAFRTRMQAEMHVVLHDVTHLTYPHWFPQAEAAKIAANLIAMMTSADALLVYSESTARDIAKVAARLRVSPAPIRRIALGADLPAAASIEPIATMPFAHLLRDRPFVMYVSSITFRKNHDFIYQVWRKLALDLGDALPRLLLVGRVAPDQEILADRIRRDVAMAGHVEILSGVTDDQLASLYTACAFTVYPSLYEGWGLPVAESLQYGKVCVTSNAASLPEASGGVAPLIDPFDHAAWCAEITRLVRTPGALQEAEARIKADYKPVTWAGAAERVRAALAMPLPARHDVSSTRSPGDSATHANDVTWRIATSEGVEPVDGLGAGDRPGTLRATGDRAHVGLLLEGLHPHGVRVSMSLEPLVTSDSHVDISLSGHLQDACPLAPAAALAPRKASAVRAVLDSRGLVDLDFSVVPARAGRVSDAERAPFLLSGIRVERLTPEEAAAADRQQHVRWMKGEILSFGAAAGARGKAFLRKGWSDPAPWGVWSVAPEASLEFLPMPFAGSALMLRATLRAFVPPQAPALDVDVLANGRRVTTWRFDHQQGDSARAERSLTIPVPADAVSRPLALTFRMPGCRSPKQLGMSADERLLGIGLMQAEWLAR